MELNNKNRKNTLGKKEAIARLDQHRKQGYTIVYTDGSQKDNENNGLGIYFEDSQEVIQKGVELSVWNL